MEYIILHVCKLYFKFFICYLFYILGNRFGAGGSSRQKIIMCVSFVFIIAIVLLFIPSFPTNDETIPRWKKDNGVEVYFELLIASIYGITRTKKIEY